MTYLALNMCFTRSFYTQNQAHTGTILTVAHTYSTYHMSLFASVNSFSLMRESVQFVHFVHA